MNLSPLFELAQVFLKLGIIGFGGPAAHIAMMEDEVVHRRQWLTQEQFLDLVGATNLIPGPNSTEMAIHIGYIYAGGLGLIVAGTCFVVPAVLMTAALAWGYVQFGELPQVYPLLYGIKPAVLAVIFTALWRLGKKAVKSRELLMIAIATAMAVWFGVNEVFALLLGGILGAVWLNWRTQPTLSAWLFGFTLSQTPNSLSPVPAVTSETVPLWKLGLFFLKVGSVLYGSGYVLIAFLQGQLVDEFGWLTQQQLLDAVAMGQVTPGPLLTTATFIGYVIGGFPGAIVSTLGITLPSFLFVLILNPWIPRLRSRKWTSAFLDAINVSAVALMAVVTVQLAVSTLQINFIGLPLWTALLQIDWIAALIAAIAAIFALVWRINAAWLVLGGAIAGWLVNRLL
ncbi:chromate efflux transporter [Laspinema olomoucense]|uniref:Chromate efflux transporter n=1 Tax=Laspinema olomoucense D3b TaxID=2953688 RepID=A0ABT2N8P7_9CYAN|nr:MULTISPECIES: chromate efflux transporter [unclassified Laspinema]MCT7971581.1 chromate efflux transporter [Laspinema sp. D3d]MCT7979073.1 chromate efflux transporter [Laspinema sp. D3b]